MQNYLVKPWIAEWLSDHDILLDQSAYDDLVAALSGAPSASAATAPQSEADTMRLTWIDENEVDIVFHREDGGDDEYTIWCNAVRNGKSVSGHPLAYVRDAIDAAIAASAQSQQAGGTE